MIYIYHNSIDAIGDKAPTESKVFDACETAIQEISGILRIIVNELSGTNIFITADHGFLYTYKPLNESDKIDRKAFSGNVYELGRRYALTAPDTTADFLLPVNLERELDGTPIKGYAPQDTIRMKVPAASCGTPRWRLPTKPIFAAPCSFDCLPRCVFEHNFLCCLK